MAYRNSRWSTDIGKDDGLNVLLKTLRIKILDLMCRLIKNISVVGISENPKKPKNIPSKTPYWEQQE